MFWLKDPRAYETAVSKQQFQSSLTKVGSQTIDSARQYGFDGKTGLRSKADSAPIKGARYRFYGWIGQ
jgi:hypothetical protein